MKREGWKGLSSRFLRELEEGKHDPSVTVPKPPEAEGEARAATPSAVEGGDVDMKVAGSSSPARPEESVAGDEPPAENGAASPSKSVTNGANGKKSEGEDGSKPTILRDDEVSVDPEGNQVLIRTLPPDIGRVKLERVCFVGLTSHPRLSYVNLCFDRCVARFQDFDTWHSVTPCKSVIIIALVGYGSTMTSICSQP